MEQKRHISGFISYYNLKGCPIQNLPMKILILQNWIPNPKTWVITFCTWLSKAIVSQEEWQLFILFPDTLYWFNKKCCSRTPFASVPTVGVVVKISRRFPSTYITYEPLSWQEGTSYISRNRTSRTTTTTIPYYCLSILVSVSNLRTKVSKLPL